MKNFYFLIILFISFYTNAQLTSTIAIINNADCFQLGTAQVTSIGGVPPYVYTISPNVGATVQSNGLITNLVAGVYEITTTDANNSSYTIVNFVVTASPPIVLVINYASTSDSVFLSATGGNGTYLYSIDNGPTQNSNYFGNIPVGNHIFKVTDSNNCNVTAPYTIVASAINTTATVTNASCFGESNGTITVAVSGGQAPFIYSLNGTALQSTSSNVFTITSLTAGNYTYSVTDQLGFARTSLATIVEASQLISTTNIVNNDIIVNTTGGTPPYQYFLNNSSSQSGNVFTGLPIGIYDILTVDNNGCSFTINAVINVAPPLINNQSAASVNFPNAGSTLADIVVQGNNVLWYANQGTGNLLNRSSRPLSDTPLPITTVVQNNTTYYASQTLNGFESQQRLAVTVTIGTVLSTTEIVFEGFKYYPNPIKNSFVVSNNSFEMQEINVLDLSGKLLLSKTINDFKSEIDFSSLTNGMYFVKIKAQDLEKTIKVFKE
jgi:Secretion system C-terminal sorting domain/SprB repeat